jgi:hypothetical protein
MLVSFHSRDVIGVVNDFSVIGITGEVARARFGRSGTVIAYYEPGRTACKLREYLESHHFSLTKDGKIVTLPVSGWDDLLRNASLSS